MRAPRRSARPRARIPSRASRPTSRPSASPPRAGSPKSCAGRRMRRSKASTPDAAASASSPISSFCENSRHGHDHRRAAGRRLQSVDVRAAEDHRRSVAAAQPRAQAAAAACRRAARVRARVGVADRRPPVVESRHRRADDRPALRLRDARGPYRLGRRPPDLSAQDPHRPARRVSEHLLKRVGVWELARRAEEHMKGMVTPSTLFEEFGFNYIGPIDGHDLDALIPTLTNIKKLKGPQFLHVITRKGQGYKLAEDDPIAYHGPGKFDPAEGLKAAAGGKPTYSQVFGQWLCDMAEREPRLVAITPAMREGSGMVEYSERFPQRYFDVGIAEQHALTFAAGLACEGMKPVVAIYSTFLQRGYDQLIHDVAIQNLPVLFALDRGGLVGGDGQTHNGAFDFAYLRTVPNLTVMAPSDAAECRQMLTTGFGLNSPAAVRYPRGAALGEAKPELNPLPIGKGEIRRS